MTNVILRGEPEAGKMHVRFKNRVSDLASRVVPVLAIVGGLSVAQAQTFDELKAAVEAADDGATVHVTSDMTFDSQIVIGSGKSVVLEGWDSSAKPAAVACMTPGFAVESCRITDDARTEAETALPPELPPHAICVVLLKAAK